MTVEQRSEGSQARGVQAQFGGLQEVRAVGALAQRFTYETVDDIPAGVNPKQLDFLRDAANAGALPKA